MPLPNTFTAEFSDSKYKGKLEYSDFNNCKFIFTSPGSISGLEITINNEKIISEYCGMEYEGIFTSNQNSIAHIIFNTISEFSLNFETLEAVTEGEQIVTRGENFKLYQNKDGSLKRIVSKGYDIEFNI